MADVLIDLLLTSFHVTSEASDEHFMSHACSALGVRWRGAKLEERIFLIPNAPESRESDRFFVSSQSLRAFHLFPEVSDMAWWEVPVFLGMLSLSVELNRKLSCADFLVTLSFSPRAWGCFIRASGLVSLLWRMDPPVPALLASQQDQYHTCHPAHRAGSLQHYHRSPASSLWLAPGSCHPFSQLWMAFLFSNSACLPVAAFLWHEQPVWVCQIFLSLEGTGTKQDLVPIKKIKLKNRIPKKAQFHWDLFYIHSTSGSTSTSNPNHEAFSKPQRQHHDQEMTIGSCPQILHSELFSEWLQKPWLSQTWTYLGQKMPLFAVSDIKDLAFVVPSLPTKTCWIGPASSWSWSSLCISDHCCRNCKSSPNSQLPVNCCKQEFLQWHFGFPSKARRDSGVGETCPDDFCLAFLCLFLVGISQFATKPSDSSELNALTAANVLSPMALNRNDTRLFGLFKVACGSVVIWAVGGLGPNRGSNPTTSC